MSLGFHIKIRHRHFITFACVLHCVCFSNRHKFSNFTFEKYLFKIKSCNKTKPSLIFETMPLSIYISHDLLWYVCCLWIQITLFCFNFPNRIFANPFFFRASSCLADCGWRDRLISESQSNLFVTYLRTQ